MPIQTHFDGPDFRFRRGTTLTSPDWRVARAAGLLRPSTSLNETSESPLARADVAAASSGVALGKAFSRRFESENTPLSRVRRLIDGVGTAERS